MGTLQTTSHIPKHSTCILFYTRWTNAHSLLCADRICILDIRKVNVMVNCFVNNVKLVIAAHCVLLPDSPVDVQYGNTVE
jgi:hypothetical protein